MTGENLIWVGVLATLLVAVGAGTSVATRTMLVRGGSARDRTEFSPTRGGHAAGDLSAIEREVRDGVGAEVEATCASDDLLQIVVRVPDPHRLRDCVERAQALVDDRFIERHSLHEVAVYVTAEVVPPGQ